MEHTCLAVRQCFMRRRQLQTEAFGKILHYNSKFATKMTPITILYFSGDSFKEKSQFWSMLAVIALSKPLLITLQESFNSSGNAVHLVFQPEGSEFCFIKEG